MTKDTASPVDCAGSTFSQGAAVDNGASALRAPISPFGVGELGWAVYGPMIGREIGTACGLETPAFAQALGRWQGAHGLATSERVDEPTLSVLATTWLLRRPFVRAARTGCPPLGVDWGAGVSPPYHASDFALITPPMTAPRASFGFKDVDPSEKPALVRGLFDRVAGRYDLMNDLMSAGVHRLWKDMTAARLNPQPGETIVDCAGGTGDIARRLAKLARQAKARRGGGDARILIVDYNAEMIAAGRERGFESEISWCVGDAQRLPLPDRSADAYVIGFGIRNVTDVATALREARRVLKPGGRFLCLEFSQPQAKAIRAAYDAYSFAVIPRIGDWVLNDKDSYQYLVESIRRFPDQATFARMIGEAGFSRAGYTNFTGGVAALHHGWAV